MPVGEFSIVFDNLNKSFFPGQNVSGSVIFACDTEKSTQGLKVKFQGKAEVKWTERQTERVRNPANGEYESKQTTKVYHDNDELFSFKVYVVGDGRSSTTIPPGRNVYPFNFTLPSMNIPSSYVGEHGRVVYEIEATQKRSWKFDRVVKEFFTVNAIVDLNKNSHVAEPVTRQTSKNFCCLCCASGPLAVNVQIPKTGYVCGEDITGTVDLNNQSSRGVNGVSITFIKIAKFHAQGKTKEVSTTLCSLRGEGVDPGDTNTWQPTLRVPAVPPSGLGGCRIINVEYQLKIELHVSGPGFNLKETIPLVIGTIPLQSAFPSLAVNLADLQPNYAMKEGFIMPPVNLGYPDMPHPVYNDAFKFASVPEAPKSMVENIAGNVIDNFLPKEEEFIPKYPSYGWVIPKAKDP